MNAKVLLLVGAALVAVLAVVFVGPRIFSALDDAGPGEADLPDDLGSGDRYGAGDSGEWVLDDRGLPAGPRLQGTPGAAPPGSGTEEAELREVLVRVLDASGVPVAGAWVTIVVGEKDVRTVATDREGLVRVTDLPVGEKAYAALGRGWKAGTALVSLSGEEVVLRAPNAISLRVHLLDAHDGAELGRGAWRVKGTERGLEGGAEARVAFNPKGRLQRPYDVEAPVGYLDWESSWYVPISRYATALTAKHPLRREVDVVIVPVDADGEDVRGAQVSAFWTANRTESSPQTEAWMLGGIPLKGVPFFPGVPLSVRVGAPPNLRGDAAVVLPKHPHEPVEVKVVLKARREGSSAAEYVETENDLPYQESWAPERTKDAPTALSGVLEILVLRADGRPADGARVRIPGVGVRRTAADGYLRIPKVLADEYEISLVEPGLVSCADSVPVVAGTTARLTLHEPDGGTLTVTVKDEEGVGLPFARFLVQTASGVPWVDLDASGVQRIDPFTDAQGVRVLTRVGPGDTIVRAVWGNRLGQATVTVRDRDAVEATVIVR